MATKNISIIHKRAGKLTRLVTAAVRTHAVSASGKIDEGLQDEEGSAFALGASLSAVADSLDRRFGVYSGKQRKLQTETGEDSTAQNARNALRDTLQAKTSKMARSINLIHGRATLSEVSLVGTVPSTPDTLVNFVGDFLNATSAANFALPEASDDHLSFDFSTARAEIADLHDKFNKSLDAMVKETKETQQARADRDRAHASWLEELRFARDIARSVLVRSDQADLAARILPTDRQISGEDPLEEDEDNNDTTPPTT